MARAAATVVAKKPPAVLLVLSFGVAEVVRLQKSPNSHEFGYPKFKT